jgi:hypothetical protein
VRARSTIRPAPHYRSDAIREGLKAAGFALQQNFKPQPGDVLVIWNRYGQYEHEAKQFEAAGAAVVVVENGYLGHRYDAYAKPFTQDGDQLFAMALWHHNGAGQWWVGEPGRWREQGIEVKPWRISGEHILILPQRGIGPPGVAMPADWPQKALRKLRTLTKLPVRVRAHPGNSPARMPLERDLAGCWCAVTWGSSAALKAICSGIPVYAGFDRWIGLEAADTADREDWLESPKCDSEARERMLDRLAWAQWSTSEIATGIPFVRLTEVYEAQRVEATS